MGRLTTRRAAILLAFASRERAGSFANDHGGVVRSFAEIAASIH